MEITAADDSFHPPAVDDPMWTETTWWGLYAADQPLGGIIYTIFRPNLGIGSVVIQLWDGEAVEPWRLPYARTQWHVPHPTDDLTRCTVGGLSIECVEPLTEYRLTYERDSCAFDLTYTALAPPDPIGGGGSGHFDQLCRATGTVEVAGSSVAIDAPVMRDRSWYVRDDARSLRAGYTYGAFADGDHFIAQGFRTPEETGDASTVVAGYVSRGGVRSRIVSGTRRVVSRHRGHPAEVVLEVEVDDGTTLLVEGRTRCSAASQSTPGMFAWMSIVDWACEGRAGTGEDHDVWSADHLSRPFAPG